MVYQIEKWHKRSFYQGPGVKFPFSWEKITLPPGLLWLFLMLKTTPLKPDFFRRVKKVKFLLTIFIPILYNDFRTNEKPAVLFIPKRGFITT